MPTNDYLRYILNLIGTILLWRRSGQYPDKSTPLVRVNHQKTWEFHRVVAGAGKVPLDGKCRLVS